MMINNCAPALAFPRLNCKARMVLALLLRDESVTEKELCRQFGHNYRSLLQRLEGDRYLWRIINVLGADGKILARKLDDRHKSGDLRLDAQARHERRVELRTKSAAQAINEAQRAARASVEKLEAIELLEVFNAKNESAPSEPEA
ncbi:hypothetical protein [Aeromonas sp. 1HA1]|uniref:hypothetical protein n=1 Tax=Aeromonas sp. 1HA1 TaxID=2699193 RepID=UPI0023DE1735|nr:hypothetical protein [Aeromonas sp. 1HA1]MDF2413045.1 hypothetical protein [Aeromonas sp. 1HA1]